MSGAYSQVDAQGAYLANVILKNGRNEIQIYPIAQHPGQLVVENHIKRFELDIDQNVACISWFNDVAGAASAKSSKRKAHDSEANGNGHANGHNHSNSMLAVGLTGGDILIFSPFKDEPTATISSIEKSVSLAPSSSAGHFWALSDDATVTEVDAMSSSVVKSFKFGKTDAQVSKIYSTDFKPVKLLAPVLLLASLAVYMADGSRAKKQVLAQLAQELDAELDQAEAAPSIECIVLVSSSIVAMARVLSSTLILHDLANPAGEPTCHQTKVGTIKRVVALNSQTLVVFGQKGAEVVELHEGGPQSRAVLRTSHSDIAFENVFYTGSTGVVGVWYDSNQPRFVKISDDIHFEGNYEISIDWHRVKSPNPEVTTPDITFVATEASDIDNKEPEQLFAALSSMLLARKVSKKSVIKLCSSNDSEENIKDTIRLFSQLSECSTLVENLFVIISNKVASDVSRKSSLSIWLKWVLLAHGGYVSKQEKLGGSLRSLQSSLDDGMKMMPKLLALQGRLQLLKSQAELRDKINSQTVPDEVESEGETEYDTFNDTFNNTTNIEESVVYANGENDDDFESITADV